MSRNGRSPLTQTKSGLAQPVLHHKDYLIHNPNRAYRADALTPPTGDKILPSPVEVIHGKKKVDLSTSDPSPSNVRSIHELATKQRMEKTAILTKSSALKLASAQQLSAAEEKAIEQMEDFYHEDQDDLNEKANRTGVGSPNRSGKQSIFLTEAKSSPLKPMTPGATAASTSSAGQPSPPKRRPLPAVVVNHPDYSSTMALLQLTRKEVEEHAKDISAISSILTLPGSIELKRTIAKMFADPKHADEISKQELERKEKKYEEDRTRQLQKQAEQLRKERELLKQELENLKS